MLDQEGFRLGIGIIICNQLGQVMWARRFKQHMWQFPQGGLNSDETPEEALYRELYEEIGLRREDVTMLANTRGWLHYLLPAHLLRHHIQPLCIGQKQKWFLLELTSSEDHVQFNLTDSPEFDRWRWVYYWYPLKKVVFFKRHVYRRALEELASFVPNANS